jgi:hypothetical protein
MCLFIPSSAYPALMCMPFAAVVVTALELIAIAVANTMNFPCTYLVYRLVYIRPLFRLSDP